MAALIIDDSPFVLRVHQKMLEKLGYHEKFYTTTHGSEAIEIIQNHTSEIDFVLLDINMPYINGLDILEIIKENAIISPIPVFVITTETENVVYNLAKRAGAMSYILKPLTLDVLKEKLLLTFSELTHYRFI